MTRDESRLIDDYKKRAELAEFKMKMVNDELKKEIEYYKKISEKDNTLSGDIARQKRENRRLTKLIGKDVMESSKLLNLEIKELSIKVNEQSNRLYNIYNKAHLMRILGPDITFTQLEADLIEIMIDTEIAVVTA